MKQNHQVYQLAMGILVTVGLDMYVELIYRLIIIKLNTTEKTIRYLKQIDVLFEWSFGQAIWNCDVLWKNGYET